MKDKNESNSSEKVDRLGQLMDNLRRSTSCVSSFNYSLGIINSQNRIYRSVNPESMMRLNAQHSIVQRIGGLVRSNTDLFNSNLVGSYASDSKLISLGKSLTAMNSDSLLRLSGSNTFQESLSKCVQNFNAESVIKVGALSPLLESLNQPFSRNLSGLVTPNNFSNLVGSALAAQSMGQLVRPIGSVFKALSRTSLYNSSVIGTEFGEILEEIPESTYTDLAKLLGEIDQNFLLQASEESLDSLEVAEEVASYISAVSEGKESDTFSISLAAKRVLIFFAQLMFALLCSAIYDANKTDFSNYWDHLRITNYIDIKTGINNAPENIDYALLEDYRIISGKGVRVRETPKRNQNNIIEQLEIGEIVYVVERGRKWSLVEVKDDSEMFQGWVSNLYLKKIKK